MIDPNDKRNKGLFDNLGMLRVGEPLDSIKMPKPRTLIMGFGVWFIFCLLMGLGLVGTVAYVAFHFLSKVW